MILPIQQNPADLALTIITGSPQIPLTVLKHQELHSGDWTLKFHIIGESHLVTIAHRGMVIFSELLACVDATLDSPIHLHRFSEMTAHSFEQRGYSINVHFDNCPGHAPSAEFDGVLQVAFPEIEGQTPITCVAWLGVSDNVVRWQTLHVYPRNDSLICVHSLSSFDMMHYNQPS